MVCWSRNKTTAFSHLAVGIHNIQVHVALENIRGMVGAKVLLQPDGNGTCVGCPVHLVCDHSTHKRSVLWWVCQWGILQVAHTLAGMYIPVCPDRWYVQPVCPDKWYVQPVCPDKWYVQSVYIYNFLEFQNTGLVKFSVCKQLENNQIVLLHQLLTPLRRIYMSFVK